MSRGTRLEVYALLRKARLQLEQAKEIHRQLEELIASIEKEDRGEPKAKTKRKIPK